MARLKTSHILRQFRPPQAGEHTDVIALASTLPEGKFIPSELEFWKLSTMRAGYHILKIARKGPARRGSEVKPSENTNSANREACAGVPRRYSGSTRVAHGKR